MKLPLLLLAAMPLAFSAGAEQTLNLGSKRFTESYILGEIIRRTADAAGETRANYRAGMGNTGIVFAALETGAIDVYPEYTGTLAREILKTAEVADIAELNRRLAPLGLGVGVPLGFNNTYALAMPEARAQALGIRRISDLASSPRLRLGMSQEFLGRADGWARLKSAYRLPFDSPAGIDHGLSFDALAKGQLDVTDIYTTDAKIKKFALRVLEDDLHYFPRYDAVLVYRLDLPARFPKSWAALKGLEGSISADKMMDMNAQAELEGKSFGAIAQDFVTGGVQTAAPGFFTRLIGPDFWQLTGEHLTLVFVSLAASILVGVPLGIVAARIPGAAAPILSGAGIIQTIPALALLAFLIPLYQRIGTLPALTALFLYSLLPIVRNTHAGLCAIAPQLRESALALGLPSLTRLTLIELPLASSTILAGVKTSAVINVGTATIAAFIGAGGYGARIAQGLALNDNGMLLAGAIPAAALALLVQWGFELLDRLLVPAPLRQSGP